MTDSFENKNSTKNDGQPKVLSAEELASLDVPRQFVVPGVSLDPHSKERTLDEDGRVFIGMNAAGFVKVPMETTGQMYTTGLGGCTGIVGTAETTDGALLGISHFDPMVDTIQRERGISPSEYFILNFIHAARNRSAKEVKISVMYDNSLKHDPLYGDVQGDYDTWHFLDQLESLPEVPEDDGLIVQYCYEGYDGVGSGGTTLTASVSPGSQASISHN